MYRILQEDDEQEFDENYSKFLIEESDIFKPLFSWIVYSNYMFSYTSYFPWSGAVVYFRPDIP